MTDLIGHFPLLQKMQRGEEVFWLNDRLNNRITGEIPKSDIAAASARLKRFAPFIERAFPEVRAAGGLIESPLRPIPRMKEHLSSVAGRALSGRLLLKCDNLLPIA